ncbi:Cytochrome c [Phlyctema vagabunda]|uniref:Cytochrome c n=1 Tax=Phlyctema vagabunda TaxID=108571 RepID=A0ABR4PV00_9HELO
MPLTAGDATRGAELYVKQCEHCHTLEKGGPHIFGPNLYGIFGQKSGQIPGSKSSQAYKDKAITWSPGTMFEYLADTKTPFPGSKKPYKGLPDEQDRSDLIAFLETQKDKPKWFGIW